MSCNHGSGVFRLSKQAIEDAYVAGYMDGRKHADMVPNDKVNAHCILGFDIWWNRTNETLDRAPPAPVCPDKSHDYRVDDSDGLLKCVICRKVLF